MSRVFEGYLLKGHKCKSRWCPRCQVPMGLDLRDRLVPVLGTFGRVLMLTVTLDPALFDSPAAALEYVRRNQCLALFVRGLRSSGCLADSGRYIWFLEFQRNGFPHWHFLVDSPFVPIHLARSIWDSFRPAEAGPVLRNRPGFGSVFFSQGGASATPEQAARYALKYVTKAPSAGWPSWITDQSRLRRFGVSRGFWGSSAPVSAAEESREVSPTRSIGEVVASCGVSSVVLRVFAEKVPSADGSELEVVRSYEYVGAVPASPARVAALLGVDLGPGLDRFDLGAAACDVLSRRYCLNFDPARDRPAGDRPAPVERLAAGVSVLAARIARVVVPVLSADELRDARAEVEWRLGCFDRRGDLEGFSYAGA